MKDQPEFLRGSLADAAMGVDVSNAAETAQVGPLHASGWNSPPS